MTNTDSAMTPGQPDDNEPRDDLDIIDQTVAQITDAHIEESLRKTLHRAGYRRGQDADADQDFTMCEHLGAHAPEAAAIAELTRINMLATAQAALRRVQGEIRAARQEAARILDEAREEADRAADRSGRSEKRGGHWSPMVLFYAGGPNCTDGTPRHDDPADSCRLAWCRLACPIR